MIILFLILILVLIVFLIINNDQKKSNVYIGLISFLVIALIFSIYWFLSMKNNKDLKYINFNYDYSNDISKYGHISKEGAVQISKNYANLKEIVDYKCELIEDDNSYWNVTISIGDTGLGYDQKYFFKIDYYSGEVLDYNYLK